MCDHHIADDDKRNEPVLKKHQRVTERVVDQDWTVHLVWRYLHDPQGWDW